MRPTRQESSSIAPEPTPQAKISSPLDEAVRSDVQRGFAWQDNGIFKVSQCGNTAVMLQADMSNQVWLPKVWSSALSTVSFRHAECAAIKPVLSGESCSVRRLSTFCIEMCVTEPTGSLCGHSLTGCACYSSIQHLSSDSSSMSGLTHLSWQAVPYISAGMSTMFG